MTLKWMDDFVGYQDPGLVNGVLTDAGHRWLTTEYEIIGNYRNNARIGIASVGPVLGTTRTLIYSGYATGSGGATDPTSPRSSFALLYNIGKHMEYGMPIHTGFRMVGFTNSPSGAPHQYAILCRVGSLFKILLGVRFGLDRISITYPEANNVRNIDIDIEILSGTHDIVECRFTKSTNSPGELSEFALYINNRVLYSGNIFSNAGAIGDIFVMPLGMCLIDMESGAGAADGYLGTWSQSLAYTFGLPPITRYLPISSHYGITDFTVNDTKGTYNNGRLGKVRVLSRFPVANDGTNEFTRSPDAEGMSNSDIVSQVPPEDDIYIQTEEDQAVEIYSVEPFSIGTEAVLASSVKMVGSKEDPSGYNLRPLYKVGSTVYAMDSVHLGPQPKVKQAIHETNPATGTAWSPTTVNSVSFGVRSSTD